MNSQKEIEIFDTLHKQYQRSALSILLTEFRKEFKQFSVNGLTFDNAEYVVSNNFNTDVMKQIMFKLHWSIGKDYGTIYAKRLRKEIPQTKAWKPLSLFNNAFRDYLLKYYTLNGGKMITSIVHTLIETVVGEIKKSTANSETLIQMRDRIYKTVNSPDFYKWQAMRIARTETTFAMNSSKVIAGEVSGAKMLKIWVHSNSGNERPEHRAIDKLAIKQDELFYVMGEHMAFPGDRENGATAKNVINCRCTFGYDAERDADGNIIWNF